MNTFNIFIVKQCYHVYCFIKTKKNVKHGEFKYYYPRSVGFPGGLAGKESSCNAGDLHLISGLGRSPGEGNGYPPQYSGLKNSMDYIVHGIAKSQTRLSNFHFHPRSTSGKLQAVPLQPKFLITLQHYPTQEILNTFFIKSSQL